ncbi:response regulator [Sphingomonas sediminicola]|jgi:CheY-like chemotaxis protein|uniref:Response regulator n=1 Tax=Sphingomonas sediminicola TaxID=386874 RepID=A0ABX6T7G6_9SPHN|nr:response regulator [Sphingomonas sediminicola]QNP45730.1 response regulator [Sphingomonas sediminicola]
MDLIGKRVLVVEDEAILAMSVEDMIHELGCVVVGPALSAADGEQLARTQALDAAVLDINMGESSSFAIATALHERAIPFGFATGYGRTGVPAEFASVPVLAKPYTGEALGEMLRRLFAVGRA